MVSNSVDVAALDDYIVESFTTQRLGGTTEREPSRGLTRTWLTQWLPADADIRSVTDADGRPIAFDTGEMHGRRAVDHFLEVMPGDAGVFEVASSARVPVEWDGTELTYALSMWRQGKGIPDQLDLSVSPPTGWEVLDASFSGGGGPGVLGPGSPGTPGTPIDVNVEDGMVRLRGSATADTRLVVRLARTDR